MNRVTKISAWLAMGLSIVAGLAISQAPPSAQKLNITIEFENGGSSRGNWCSPILPETGWFLGHGLSTYSIRRTACITCG